MKLTVLPEALSVCQIADVSHVVWRGAFCSLTRAGEEISLVCETRFAPDDALKREDGWRAFRVEGPLPFALVGVMASLTAALAAANVSVFALSTYDTDYLLVKESAFDRAKAALAGAGFCL